MSFVRKLLRRRPTADTAQSEPERAQGAEAGPHESEVLVWKRTSHRLRWIKKGTLDHVSRADLTIASTANKLWPNHQCECADIDDAQIAQIAQIFVAYDELLQKFVVPAAGFP